MSSLGEYIIADKHPLVSKCTPFFVDVNVFGRKFLKDRAVSLVKISIEKLIEFLGYTMKDVEEGNLGDIKNRMKDKDLTSLASDLGIGVPTLRDIVDEITKPGRDPRDSVEQPLLRDDVMSMEDLKPDMILTGTVRNVIDFGAFVDIGVHQDGLVHISQLCDKYVKHPMDVVSIGDIVKVKVLEVDVQKKRISLTMKGI